MRSTLYCRLEAPHLMRYLSRAGEPREVVRCSIRGFYSPIEVTQLRSGTPPEQEQAVLFLLQTAANALATPFGAKATMAVRRLLGASLSYSSSLTTLRTLLHHHTLRGNTTSNHKDRRCVRREGALFSVAGERRSCVGVRGNTRPAALRLAVGAEGDD